MKDIYVPGSCKNKSLLHLSVIATPSHFTGLLWDKNHIIVWMRKESSTHKDSQGNRQWEPVYRLFVLVRRPITHHQNTSAFHFWEQKKPFPCSYWEQHTTYATWTAPSQKSYKKRTHAISYYCNFRVFQVNIVTIWYLSHLKLKCLELAALRPFKDEKKTKNPDKYVP